MTQISPGRQDSTPEKDNDKEVFDSKASIHDEKALEEIYAANYSAIEKYILANSGTRDDAKDIYQESFLTFWRNVQLNRFQPQHANAVSSYLLRIARNKWIDVLRKDKRMNVASMENEYADNMADDQLSPEEEQYLDIVKSHYINMGEPCKELLYRFYFKKEMLKQIAAYFSWTEATAKNNKYRCLHKLKSTVLNKI